MISVALDNFSRADQAGLGTASDGEAYTNAFGTGTKSIVGGQGQITTPNGSTGVLLGTGMLSQPDIVVQWTPSATDVYFGPIFAWQDSSNYCYVEIVNLAMRLWQVVGGVATQIATSSFSVTANKPYWCHLNVSGNTAKVRAWANGTQEPTTWPTSATNSRFGLCGRYGLRAFISSNGETVLFSNFTVRATPSIYFVSPYGKDSNPGTLQEPFLTMGKAESVIQAGDSILVGDGSYALQPSAGAAFYSKKSGTALAPIKYQAISPYGAKFNPTTAQYVWQSDGDYNYWNYFELTSQDPTTRIGLYNNGSHCSAQQMKVHDLQAVGNGSSGGAGIDHANFLASDNDTIGCTTYAIGTATDRNVHGIYHACLRGNIKNNISIGNSGWGIHMWHGANNVNVYNNLSAGNATGGIVVGAVSGEGTGINDNTTVANNIMLFNGLTSSLSAGALYETGVTGTNNRYLNNLLFGNANVNGTNSPISLQNGLQDVGTINADPQLVAYRANAQGDYHLMSTSTAIGAGYVSGAPTTDFDGRMRGASIDIGPFQYALQADVARGIVRHGEEPMQQGYPTFGMIYKRPSALNAIKQDIARARKWMGL